MSRKFLIKLKKVIIVCIFLISILSFVYVFAQEPAITITNSGNPILTTIEEKNLINYKFDWGETEVTLYKGSEIFNNIYIQPKEKGWKFGANDSLKENETARYKYVVNSTDKLVLLTKSRFNEKENFNYSYVIVYNYKENPKDYWNEFRHVYNFKDICSKQYSDCEWLFDGNSIEISFTSTGNIDPSIENVSSCKTLNTTGQYYQQNQSIIQTSSTVDCIIIDAENITFDGNIYSITSSQDVSGVYSNSYNTTIKNCNISMGRGSGGYGIELGEVLFGYADNSYIYNCTLNNQNYGIYSYSVVYPNDNLKIEKVTANNNSGYGIYLFIAGLSGSNNLTNIEASNNTNDGIFLDSNKDNTLTNIITNSNGDDGIECSDTGNVLTNVTANSNADAGISLVNSNNLIDITANWNNDGITVSDSNNLTNIEASNNSVCGINADDNNNLTNIITNNNSACGIAIWGSNNVLTNNTAISNAFGIVLTLGAVNNVVTDMAAESNNYRLYFYSNSNNNNVTNSNISGSSLYDVYSLDNCVNNTLLNVSYDINRENITSGCGVIRKWYYQAKVNDTLGANVEGANVSAWNVSGNLQFSVLTESDGKIVTKELIDYINNGGTRSYYSNYTINVSKSCYETLSKSHNITAETNIYKDVFTLIDITPPNINFTYPTLSNGATTTNTSIEINVSIVESSLGEVKYNWNGTNYSLYDSSLVLFMNFNNLSALGESSTLVADLSKYSNNGTCISTGCPTLTGGKYGNSDYFNNNYLNISRNSNLDFATASFSYNLWFNSSGTTTGEIVCKQSGTASSTAAGFRAIRSSNSATGISIVLGNGSNNYRLDTGTITACWASSNWCMLTVTIDRINNNMSVYINGVFVANKTIGTGSIANNYDIRLGNTVDGTVSRFFTGRLDEFMMFNRTLSSSEISELYMLSLQKYNATQWYLYVNQSKNATAGLDGGTYTYFASAKDVIGNENMTEIRSITIIIPDNPPSVTLNFPPNGETLNYTSIDFNFTATDDYNLTNATLYFCNVTAGGCDSNGFTANKTITISGKSNSTNITVIMIDNRTYWWNIYVCDNSSQCRFASSNFTLIINTSYVAPVVYPVFGVLHSIHTAISADGTMSQSQRVSNLKNNYDWATTSDHDIYTTDQEWIDTKNEANGNNADNKFTYFIGYEWTIGIGHRLAFYNSDDLTICRSNLACNTVPLLTAHLQANNGLATHNHPATTLIDWSNINNRNDTYIPLVEMTNKGKYFWNNNWDCSANSGCSTYTNPNPPGGANWLGAVKRALDLGYYLGFVAGWDYHGAYPGNPTDYVGLVNPPNFTRDGIFETLKARHTWAADDKIIMNVTAFNGSDTLVMGDIFGTTTQNFYVNYSINGVVGHNIVNVSFFFDGVIINLTKFSGQQNVVGYFNYTFSVSDNSEHYMFVEAVQDNSRRAWSSPMYVTYSP